MLVCVLCELLIAYAEENNSRHHYRGLRVYHSAVVVTARLHYRVDSGHYSSTSSGGGGATWGVPLGRQALIDC